jgi:hypothetical protein
MNHMDMHFIRQRQQLADSALGGRTKSLWRVYHRLGSGKLRNISQLHATRTYLSIRNSIWGVTI